MSFRDFPLYLMETLKCWSSLHEYIFVFMFLISVSKGSACEAPSTPECFRRNTEECSGRYTEECSVYVCEWSMNTTDSDVTYDLCFDYCRKKDYMERTHGLDINGSCYANENTLIFSKKKFRSNKKTCKLIEELLITKRPVDIWVKAHIGNSSCSSTRRSVTLKDTVKYEAPQNISMSWLKNNLNLSWPAAEKCPALAEIRFRRDEHPTESWEKRTTNTTSDNDMYHVIVVSLLKDSAFQVQIRHQPTKVLNPLWSDWSPVVTVPAELEQKPEVDMTTRLLNGTREVTLTWKPMPRAAAVRGVTYSLEDTQSSNECPCEKNRHPINKTKHTIYVSLSAVNISVIARNAAGYSPPEIRHVAAEPAADLKICDKTLLHEKLNPKTCLEWYELQDGDSRPENVNTLTAGMEEKKRKQIRMNITDYVRYLYFEHRCDGGRPQTVKMCLFYQKEGVPLREPQDFRTFSETHTSANLSWKAIPSVDQRGFLTHYSLCSVKISSQDEPKECCKISASLTKHRLENLTPGAKYNISLVGVTRVGQGPEATVTISTSPENPVNVWWSLGLLLLFFFITTMGTCILKRIKNKIFPPVPTPVIPDFSPYQAECQEFLERKEEVEEVHELTLHQYPESKSVPEDAEETTVLTGEWDDGTDEDVENERGDSRMSGGTNDDCVSPGSTDEALRSSRDGEMTDLEQVDNEIAMLIYKNGLVFDVKTDSP